MAGTIESTVKHAVLSLLFLTACESMVMEDLTYDVSDEAVAATTQWKKVPICGGDLAADLAL